MGPHGGSSSMRKGRWSEMLWLEALCSRSGAHTRTSPSGRSASARARSPGASIPSSLLTRIRTQCAVPAHRRGRNRRTRGGDLAGTLRALSSSALVLRAVFVAQLDHLVEHLDRDDFPADDGVRLLADFVPLRNVGRLDDVEAPLLHLLDGFVVLLADVLAGALAVLLAEREQLLADGVGNLLPRVALHHPGAGQEAPVHVEHVARLLEDVGGEGVERRRRGRVYA